MVDLTIPAGSSEIKRLPEEELSWSGGRQEDPEMLSSRITDLRHWI